MSLNDADKKRIYEEEEARLEARKKIEKKAKEKKERFQGAIGLAIISIILIWCAQEINQQPLSHRLTK